MTELDNAVGAADGGAAGVGVAPPRKTKGAGNGAMNGLDDPSVGGHSSDGGSDEDKLLMGDGKDGDDLDDGGEDGKGDESKRYARCPRLIYPYTIPHVAARRSRASRFHSPGFHRASVCRCIASSYGKHTCVGSVWEGGWDRLRSLLGFETF